MLLPLLSRLLTRGAFYGAAAGLAAGLASVCYRALLAGAEAASIRALAGGAASLALLLPVWAAGGLAIGWIMEREPAARRGGVAQVRRELDASGPGMSWLRVIVAKFAAGSLGIALGMSLGRGGPSVQIGAAAGKGTARALGVAGDGERSLMAAGAAAGLSATFNAPIAGAVFALEVACGAPSVGVVAAVVVASQVAGLVAALAFGPGPLFSFGGAAVPPAALLWHFPVMGALCGVASVLFERSMRGLDLLYGRLPAPARLRPAIPAMLALAVADLMPVALAGGHGMVESVGAGGYDPSTLLSAFAVKMAFTAVCICSEAAGGLFYPMLASGAALGALYGALFCPEWQVGFLIAGMAGMISGVMRAPATGVILAAEMTAAPAHMLPAALAAIASFAVVRGLSGEGE
ncbi:MAG: H(+)/Cl(-) exchange transporter ClcA [Synergistetes bacterium ADurb.BinA166]|nr:MAG: H(+)/Cl(-) exchange transporter ClcA [Synergistetes bacterium ADurb.BinA166]